MSLHRIISLTIIYSAFIAALSMALIALVIRVVHGLGYIDCLATLGHSVALAFIVPIAVLVGATCAVLWSICLGVLLVMLSMQAIPYRLRLVPALGVSYVVGALFLHNRLHQWMPIPTCYVAFSLGAVSLFGVLVFLWLHRVVIALKPRWSCPTCGCILRGVSYAAIPITLTESLAGPRVVCPECGAQSRIDPRTLRRA